MLGTNIAILRQKAGFSQAALAKRLHISPSTLGMYEQGRREPSLDTLVALADELGVSTDTLLSRTPSGRISQSTAKPEAPLPSPDLAAEYCKAQFKLASRDELAVLCLALLMDS